MKFDFVENSNVGKSGYETACDEFINFINGALANIPIENINMSSVSNETKKLERKKDDLTIFIEQNHCIDHSQPTFEWTTYKITLMLSRFFDNGFKTYSEYYSYTKDNLSKKIVERTTHEDEYITKEKSSNHISQRHNVGLNEMKKMLDFVSATLKEEILNHV